MTEHMGYEAAPRQESRENAVLSPQSAAATPKWFIILNHLSPFWNWQFRFFAPVF